MKKFQLFACAFAAALFSFSFNACSDDDPEIGPNNPENPEEPEEPETPASTTHFDVWVTVGGTGGMGSTDAILVKSLDSLTAQPMIDFKNDGADVTGKIKQETIFKGKYYYQVPESGDRFGKYQIVNNKLQTVLEQPFVKSTFKARFYTHAWLDDNTLVIMAANGKKDKVIWTKLNAENMTILSEGELSLEIPEGDTFSSSGLVRYRKSDDKLIYFFQHKKETKNFYAAFINTKDMSVEKEVKEDRAEQMAGTAYGELLQDKIFMDENDNLYLACNSQIPNSEKSTCQYGRLLRIKKGELDFDKSYEGYKDYTGKLVTVDYIGGNKAILYIQDPQYTGTSTDNALYKGWGDAYNGYYALLDLATDQKEEFTCDGTKLPYSSGTFSQRSFVTADKAYIGVNPETSNPCVYIYDIKSGTMEKGLTIAEGYGFDRITLMDNADAK